MISAELKPCPFCGSPATIYQASNDARWWIIRCADQADDAAMACRACPEVQEDNREMAIVHWNHREGLSQEDRDACLRAGGCPDPPQTLEPAQRESLESPEHGDLTK